MTAQERGCLDDELGDDPTDDDIDEYAGTDGDED